MRKFGLIPEILGRLPVLANLSPLDRPTLKRILLEPKNALLKQYKKLFELENKELIVSHEVVELIVDTAFECKLGARGLRSICESIFMDAMYDAPSSKESKIEIKKAFVKKKSQSFLNKPLKASFKFQILPEINLIHFLTRFF